MNSHRGPLHPNAQHTQRAQAAISYPARLRHLFRPDVARQLPGARSSSPQMGRGFATKPFHEVAPTLMDIIAVVGSLLSAASFAPVLAFSHDDLTAADARYLNTYNATVTSTDVVSTYLYILVTISTSTSLIAVMIAVGVRSSLLLLPEELMIRHPSVETWLMVPASLSILLLMVNVFTFTGLWFWVVWIVVPVTVASSSLQFFLGTLFMLMITFVFVYFSALILFLRGYARKARVEKRESKVGIESTSHEGREPKRTPPVTTPPGPGTGRQYM